MIDNISFWREMDMRRRNRSGTLIPIIILALFIGGVASFFDRTKTSDEIIEENGTVWGEEYTSLDEFEYYVNGDEIIITDHIGDSQMLNIKPEYDGRKVVRLESAPFMGSNAISVIVPDGVTSMDNNVFNSCDIEYLYLPSTLTDVEDGFWDYFHDTKELYYGGTQEDWNKICHIARNELAIQELYCNVSISDLGTEKAKETPIIMSNDFDDLENRESEFFQVEESSLTPKGQFIQDSSGYISSDVSNKLYDIITSDLGFENAEFIGKDESGDSIWDVRCDDISVMVTASDDVYRIWSGDYTFYAEGTIVTTKEQMESTRITPDEQTSYYLIAQEIVSQYLKNPGSADFPSIALHPEEIGMAKKDDIIGVQGYVDATNSFGGTVRSQWTVEFRIIDLSSFSYETLYINIDGQSSGTYIELN